MVKETENTVKKSRPAKKADPTEGISSARPESAENTNDKVGIMLYNERIKKGLELKEISQVLCIRRFYLQAIEEGNYADLPALPYSAGFVNSYAKYLGLNNTRITQLFREELNIKPEHKGIFMIEEPTSEASAPNLRYIIGSLIGLLLIVLLWSMVFGNSADETVPAETTVAAESKSANGNSLEVEYFNTTPDKTATDSLTPAGEQTAAANDVPAAAEAPAEENAAASQVIIKEENFSEDKLAEPQTYPGIEIKITKNDTWIEVRDGKKIYINKVLHPGESYQIPSGSGMVLSVGKYDGVEVRVNGALTPVIKPNRKMNIKLDDLLNTH